MSIDARIQQEWATWKYYVMSRSQQQYNDIRQLFSGNQWSPQKDAQFHSLLEEAQRTNPTLGSLRNAYQHVWGYFKRVATADEKKVFQQTLASLTLTRDEVAPLLRNLATHYQIDYLQQSKLLFP
ncbi:YbgA family protein [uncultured Vagococcus sp.]|uniref:YbgA family protein n=1 Tax=uncultured Vagococcus sp. TaxID=189676 RepID=UPI0028D90E44|nr:YbgA family protein [uncultured Vagococcus sp.]